MPKSMVPVAGKRRIRRNTLSDHSILITIITSRIIDISLLLLLFLLLITCRSKYINHCYHLD